MSIETDLNTLGITYSEIENDLYKLFPKEVFNSQLEIEELDLYIPNNSNYDYAIYEIPALKEIETIPRGRYGKDLLPISGWDAMGLEEIAIETFGVLPFHLPSYLAGVGISPFLPSDLPFFLGQTTDETIVEESGLSEGTIYRDTDFSIHGNNLLFETSEDAKHLKLEVKVTNKTISNIEKDLRFDIMAAYYYLYRGNTDEVYSYVRLISNAIDNVRNQKHRNLQERKIPLDRKVTPWQL